MTVSTDERYAALARRLESELAEARNSIERIDRDINALTTDVGDEGSGPTTHPADEGADVYDIERLKTVRVDFETIIERIEAAQARMADGTYGTCANCGRPIPIERHEALPYATLCIDCQEQAET